MENQVEEIKRKVDIVGLVSEFVELKRAGRNFKGLCPFHSEKTPSFMVSPELQIFKCFGCGAGGDAYKFLMEFEKIEFPQALKILADRTGVKLRPVHGFASFAPKEEIYQANYLTSEFYHYLLVGHEIGRQALEYLRKRGLSNEAIGAFKLGWSPDKPEATFRFLTQKRGYKPELLEKAGLVVHRDNQYFDRFRGRIIFPLHDHYGNTLGFAGRVLEDKGDLAKYINTPDTLVYKKGQVLYGLDVTKQDIKNAGFAVLVEGEIDAIASWQAGVRNVVAIKGSALTEDQVRLILRFCPKVVLALDSDFAGDQAARRGIEIAQKQGLEIKVASLGPPDGPLRSEASEASKFKDPGEFAMVDKAGWKKAVEMAKNVYDFFIDSAFEKNDAKTTEGKAKISRELAPVLAGIEDEIVRAHCIQKVAVGLDIAEDAVSRQVEKYIAPASVSKEETQKSNTKKTRREVIETYVLSLAFQGDPTLLQDKRVVSLIKTPVARRIMEEYSQHSQTHGSFDPKVFAGQLSPELSDAFASIILSDIESDLPEDRVEQEIENIKRELEILDIRTKMDELAGKIKLLEAQGKIHEMSKLELELAQSSAKLAELEVS